MKEDLRKLLISPQEMYAASGFVKIVDAIQEYRGSMARSIDNCLKFLALGAALGMGTLAVIAFIFASTYSGGLLPLAILPGMIALGSGLALLAARGTDFQARYIAGKYGKEYLERYSHYCRPQHTQQRLYEEVEHYNKLVRAIHVSDEIDAVGVHDAKIQQRDVVLNSLSVARVDLMRALKIERIMRENADVSGAEFQLFSVDLTHVAAMQVEDAASQQGRVMNEAFEIARTVQLEVRKLQDQDRQRVR